MHRRVLAGQFPATTFCQASKDMPTQSRGHGTRRGPCIMKGSGVGTHRTRHGFAQKRHFGRGYLLCKHESFCADLVDVVGRFAHRRTLNRLSGHRVFGKSPHGEHQVWCLYHLSSVHHEKCLDCWRKSFGHSYLKSSKLLCQASRCGVELLISHGGFGRYVKFFDRRNRQETRAASTQWSTERASLSAHSDSFV